jgi:hypothetical protein
MPPVPTTPPDPDDEPCADDVDPEVAGAPLVLVLVVVLIVPVDVALPPIAVALDDDPPFEEQTATSPTSSGSQTSDTCEGRPCLSMFLRWAASALAMKGYTLEHPKVA